MRVVLIGARIRTRCLAKNREEVTTMIDDRASWLIGPAIYLLMGLALVLHAAL